MVDVESKLNQSQSELERVVNRNQDPGSGGRSRVSPTKQGREYELAKRLNDIFVYLCLFEKLKMSKDDEG